MCIMYREADRNRIVLESDYRFQRIINKQLSILCEVYTLYHIFYKLY